MYPCIMCISVIEQLDSKVFGRAWSCCNSWNKCTIVALIVCRACHLVVFYKENKSSIINTCIASYKSTISIISTIEKASAMS
jgi:hypothetical protein